MHNLMYLCLPPNSFLSRTRRFEETRKNNGIFIANPTISLPILYKLISQLTARSQKSTNDNTANKKYFSCSIKVLYIITILFIDLIWPFSLLKLAISIILSHGWILLQVNQIASNG
jgi:hypothetical protein